MEKQAFVDPGSCHVQCAGQQGGVGIMRVCGAARRLPPVQALERFKHGTGGVMSSSLFPSPAQVGLAPRVQEACSEVQPLVCILLRMRSEALL